MSEAPVALPSIDSIIDFLEAFNRGEAEQLAEAAVEAFEVWFPHPAWTVSWNVNEFGPDAHANLYKTECPRDFREWLAARGVDAQGYAEAVGPIQYLSLEAILSSLTERRANRGWRVRIVGYPALRIAAVGLGSHYQGTQSQASMGAASALIREQAIAAIGDRLPGAFDDWPAAAAHHWDERGLMTGPALRVGSLDIAEYDDGQGARLRMARNTTVKKELSTFFGVRGFHYSQLRTDGPEVLTTLRKIASTLGSASA